MAGRQLPTEAGLSIQSNTTKIITSGTARLTPGIYVNGINVRSAVVDLDPGLYVVRGGGISVSSGGVLRGQGVTVLYTGSANQDRLTVSDGTVSLSAPTSGAAKDLLLISTVTNEPVGINLANSSATLKGTVWMRGGNANVRNSKLTGAMQLILGSLDAQNGSVVDVTTAR
jgi:hypothetical protein